MRARRFAWYDRAVESRVYLYRHEIECQWNEEKHIRAVARKSAKTFTNTHEILLRENGEYLLLEVGKRGAKVYASLEDLALSLTLQRVDVTHLKERDEENVVDHNN